MIRYNDFLLRKDGSLNIWCFPTLAIPTFRDKKKTSPWSGFACYMLRRLPIFTHRNALGLLQHQATSLHWLVNPHSWITWIIPYVTKRSFSFSLGTCSESKKTVGWYPSWNCHQFTRFFFLAPVFPVTPTDGLPFPKCSQKFRSQSKWKFRNSCSSFRFLRPLCAYT